MPDIEQLQAQLDRCAAEYNALLRLSSEQIQRAQNQRAEDIVIYIRELDSLAKRYGDLQQQYDEQVAIYSDAYRVIDTVRKNIGSCARDLHQALEVFDAKMLKRGYAPNG